MSVDGAAKPTGAASIYDALRPALGRRSLRRLPRLVGRAVELVWSAARREVAIAAVLQVLGGAALAVQLLLARSFLAALVDSPDAARSIGDVAPLMVGLAVVTALGGFVTAAIQERQRLLSELTARHSLGRLLDVASTVELEAFEAPEFHDQMLRATINAQVRPAQVASGLLNVTSGVVGVLGVAVALATLEPLVVPLVLLGFGPLWLAATRNSQSLYQLSVDLTPADRERAYLQQLLWGKAEAKELRAFQLAGFLRSRYERLYDARMSRIRRLVALRQRRALLATAAASAVALLAIAGLVQLALSGRMSLATAGAAALGVQLLSIRLRGLFSGASSLYECSLFLEDVTSFLQLQTAGHTSQESGLQPEPFSRVRLEGLWFAYPGTERSVLRDVNIEIGRGEVVALVGENGSGKTTLVKLLCGLYRPTAGRIMWGDVDLVDVDLEAARRQVAVIFQDYLRYELSASANIGVGRHEHFADFDRVRAAADQAGAESFLRGLPSGYDTLLSRAFLGGSELSVGQWQRVALARALFRDAPLVILDEPSAALDAKAEHELFARSQELLRDRAVLLISHRFSSVRWADRIYVLSDGAVIESGDHRSLMQSGGLYSELFELQADAFRDRPE